MSDDSAQFWRDVQAVARKEIEDFFQPTGVRPAAYAGQTLDRFGRTTYAEYRRGVAAFFNTGTAITAGTALGDTGAGTLVAGTADIRYNDGSAFWGTAQPTRFYAPVPGRYILTAYVQGSMASGTAAVSSAIGLGSNGTASWIIGHSEVVDADIYPNYVAGIAHTIGHTVNMQGSAYAVLSLGITNLGGGTSVSFFNCSFAMERIG